MAEGLLRHLAGTLRSLARARRRPVNPSAVDAMRELGIDISPTARHVDEVPVTFDLVITVCDRAREACPSFPGPVPSMELR
jgi:arsenate reductase